MSSSTGTGRLCSALGSRHTRILGVGAYRPVRVITNDEIAARIGSSDEWITSRSGIRTRHWAGPDETLADMSAVAGGKALAEAGVAPDQIGCVLLATSTHFRQLPAGATEIADRLGIRGAAALDVSAACAGFTHALALASDMVRAGTADHVLVIGAERMSDLLDHDDRGTAFLFGDGAGAVVVGPSDTAGIGPVVWGADGSKADVITQTVDWRRLRDDPGHRFPALTMQGPAVFRWASYTMAEVAAEVLERSGVTAGDLAALIPHQANLRITDAMVRALKLPDTVAVARDVVDTGNTSAASIPLAMERLIGDGRVTTGGLALLIGFGAGLSYAAQVVTLP